MRGLLTNRNNVYTGARVDELQGTPEGRSRTPEEDPHLPASIKASNPGVTSATPETLLFIATERAP